MEQPGRLDERFGLRSTRARAGRKSQGGKSPELDKPEGSLGKKPRGVSPELEQPDESFGLRSIRAQAERKSREVEARS